MVRSKRQRTRRRSWIGAATIGATAVTLLSTGVEPGLAFPGRDAETEHRRGRQLVEDRPCNDGVAGREDVESAGTNVTVTVPPVALVRLDRRGRIAAAATNTGCAPRASDDVYIVRRDGRARPASARFVERRLDRRWVGDFTERGVYQRQPRGWMRAATDFGGWADAAAVTPPRSN